MMKRLPLRSDEYDGLKWASACEKAIRSKIEELSGLHLKPVGHGTESSEIINAPIKKKIEHLDYEVVLNRKVIAILEISCTNYSFEGSEFFPINAYKWRVEKLPTYYVYSLEKEPYDLPQRCWWISHEKAVKSLLKPNPVWLNTRRPGGIKPQLNYLTDKDAWTRGLQNLIDELLNNVSENTNGI